MTTERKSTKKLAAAKSRPKTKSKSAVPKRADDKSASRQKAGVVAVIGVTEKSSKKTAPTVKPAKTPSEKPVRDDFKMPAGDYALIEALKQRALEFNRPTKKNELLRAGLQALGALDNTQLQQRLLALKPAKRKTASVKGAKSRV